MHWKNLVTVFVISIVAAHAAHAEANGDVKITVDTDKVTHQVDPKVYGHFYEHIYHSANGGLWGNVVWNRSFEQPASSAWTIDESVIRQNSVTATGATIGFGDLGWRDIDFSLQAKKIRGNEGFLILVGKAGRAGHVWINLGGWGNSEHGIEDLRNGSKGLLGRRKRGSIESGRWYDIRIRSEGNRIQVWLDGEQLMDETATGAPLVGQVGVGTWSTVAEFRNFQVKSLSGKTLLDGMPPLERGGQLPEVAANWQIVSGQAEISDDNPLNDQFSAVLTPDAGGKATISQPHVKLDSSDPLAGSIWLRADGVAKANIQVLNEDDKVLARQEIKGISSAWQEFSVNLSPTADAKEGRLQVTADSEQTVSVDQFSLMPASAAANDNFRADLYEALAGLKPTIIRWPGGCYAEQYHWMNGVGPQHTRKMNLIQQWEDCDPNSLGTDEFIELCRKLDAEPLMVINTGMHPEGTSTPEAWKPWLDEAVAWIEYCNGSTDTKYGAMRAANGHPEPYEIKYWEIDNELWRSQQRDPAVYVEAVKLFAPAMRAKDPSITILAHGGNSLDRRYNQVLLDGAAEHFDILSIHHYQNPNLFSSGVGDQEQLYIDTRTAVAESSNPDIKLYVSEWNAQTIDWRTGLYAGGLLNAFERQGDFLIIGGPALLMREKTAGAWDNAFINFDQNSWFPAPNYVVMKLWRDHFAPNFLALAGDLNGSNIVATKGDDGQNVYLKAVNPTEFEKTITIELEGDFEPKSASMLLVAPGGLDARNSFEQPSAVKPNTLSAEVKGEVVTFSMPAYSAGVVTVRGDE
ncbi:Intracellular exo-alpha-(1-_5)-L-arabinofuranosidase [Planctomycetes bacterium CA13]|uniref:non-reducing end alpha-L-arabinofuranosidase n=2 Tax=Novipirellula herctigrandis TaxID=2527986 RepID=A0A5C5ZBV0_9BACT|nr:Intracellular exo-alpha-(1->5)-L-arabinofuranosidase [Planctomycetes bacterium CA13]